MAIFIKLPNGQQVRLPRTGETVMVNFPDKDWGWLPAIVDQRDEKAGDMALLNLVVFNRFTFPTRTHFRQDVAHGYFSDGVRPVWQHIPQA